MRIRSFVPGDEAIQAAIYNAAAAALPAFKPASAEEVARRYLAVASDPGARLYAEVGDRVVGYVVFNPNGRISYPWHLAGFEACREALFQAALLAMRRRGHAVAWATYRADWEAVLSFLQEQGLKKTRDTINYLAELSRLPHEALPAERAVVPLARSDLAAMAAMGAGILATTDEAELDRFFFQNPYLDAGSIFVLKDRAAGGALGFAVAVQNPAYAHPAKIDAAMPCFRLGALGSERERHKRVNGLFSCLFSEEKAGEQLLAEAVRRLERDGQTHAAAQVASDQTRLVAFYDRFFERQAAFPILVRRLEDVPT